MILRHLEPPLQMTLPHVTWHWFWSRSRECWLRNNLNTLSCFLRPSLSYSHLPFKLQVRAARRWLPFSSPPLLYCPCLTQVRAMCGSAFSALSCTCFQAVEAFVVYRPFCGLMSTSVPFMSHSLLLTCTPPACSMNIVCWLVSGKSYLQLSINTLLTYICHSCGQPRSCHRRPLHSLCPLNGRPFSDHVRSSLPCWMSEVWLWMVETGHSYSIITYCRYISCISDILDFPTISKYFTQFDCGFQWQKCLYLRYCVIH